MKLARTLRDAGVSVELPPEEMKFKKALGRADKLDARYALIIGGDEVASQQYTLKRLADGHSEASLTRATKDVAFTLTYNPSLFTPTGTGTGDSTGTGSTFTMGTISGVDAAHAKVTFTWHNSAGLTGAIVLGDILGNVPNSAANLYKGKELLDSVATPPALVNDKIFLGTTHGDVVCLAAKSGEVLWTAAIGELLFIQSG